jgi:hypothetical protein
VLGSDGAYTQLRPAEDSDARAALGTPQVMMNLMRARA